MSTSLKVALAAVAAIVAFLLLRWGKGLFVPHAALVGLAIGALTYSLLRTVERLRTVYRKPRSRRRPPE